MYYRDSSEIINTDSIKYQWFTLGKSILGFSSGYAIAKFYTKYKIRVNFTIAYQNALTLT